MRTRRTATIDDLRCAIECLPRHTRIAMLEGINNEQIIVGAYTNPSGVCPMLAAHRRGGRTDCVSFARAWDAFAFRGARKQNARRASPRELLVLRSHLEASLLEDEGPDSALTAAIAGHRALVADRAESRDGRAVASGDTDRNRTPELRGRPGWSWLQVVRRYDDYQRALELLDDACAEDRRGQPTAAR